MILPHFSFIQAFGLRKGGVACIVGAGGKTSLLFQLAVEARAQGWKTLVSTTTKMCIPGCEKFDDIDLDGCGFLDNIPQQPGIYVAGRPVSSFKMRGIPEADFLLKSPYFDLVLLEADGAAKKPLKGWLDTEPVIPACTTHTIGVVDIQTLGKRVNEDLVHRLDCFTELTGAKTGDKVSVDSLKRLVVHKKGLFFHASGRKIVYLNKVESIQNKHDAELLKSLLSGLLVCSGSVKLKIIQPDINFAIET